KDAIFAETAKVLTAGGTFALFDVMQMTPDAELPFPFPWAEKAEQSFTAAPEIYEAAAKASGFSQIAKRNRKDFALDFFDRAFAAVEAAGKPSPLGIHLLMRETALQKLKNYVAAVEQGLLAPVEMIFRAPA
ncbi:MAG: SAM-dependent methyltransferase, partial [Pseudomonadota bacterium]